MEKFEPGDIIEVVDVNQCGVPSVLHIGQLFTFKCYYADGGTKQKLRVEEDFNPWFADRFKLNEKCAHDKDFTKKLENLVLE